MTPLPENSVIGIFGGGQLGRMIIEAAAALGYRCHVFAPAGDAPAGDIATATTRADYTDEGALAAFAEAVDSVVSEFENVPVTAMQKLAGYVPVCPGAKALAISQHRIDEKNAARALGIETPRFAAIHQRDEKALATALTEFGGGVLKTCRMGYDGKGQLWLTAKADTAKALAELKTGPEADELILEEPIDFIAEASFMVARDRNGNIRHWPATLNRHRDGVLYQSEAPADSALLDDALARQGFDAAAAIAEALELTGVLAVEMFITKDKRLLFNEMAPRPHNSYHWTIEGAETSQFAQLVRIAAGLPLGSTRAMGHWRMTNILGEDMAALDAALATDGVFIHRYGKAEARSGRKMAHLNQRLDQRSASRVVRSKGVA